MEWCFGYILSLVILEDKLPTLNQFQESVVVNYKRSFLRWTSKNIIISCFRQIYSPYYSEFGESAVCYKCHQLRFLIRCINRAAARTFYLGPNADFYEGGISTQSRFWCVWKYNKYKPYKFRIDLFVLAGSKYCLFRDLDVYQGKNALNIDIHHCAKQLSTTTKAVINAAIASKISNNHCGLRKLFLDNRYDCPELFVVLFEKMNLIGGGTCRNIE